DRADDASGPGRPGTLGAGCRTTGSGQPGAGLVRPGAPRRAGRVAADGGLRLRPAGHPPAGQRPDPAQPAPGALPAADAGQAAAPAPADRRADHDPLRGAGGRVAGGGGGPAVSDGRLAGGRRIHLVDGDRDELRQGRPRPPGSRGGAVGAAHRRGGPGSVAQQGGVGPGGLGAEVHPDRSRRHLLPVRVDQDPQRGLELHVVAQQRHPHLGDHPTAARARSVPAAVPRPAPRHAVVRVPGRARLGGGAVAARQGAAGRRGLLVGFPPVHRGDPLHPLRADAGLLARLRPTGAAACVVAASKVRAGAAEGRAAV
ncbi:MAG: hypothetical protein AVDCRST_MAG61-3383, partial [uncultured Friedmanniella sp.]